MLRSMLGGRVFGETWGEGPPTVLALHGWRRTHADLAGVLGPASPGGPVATIAPDLPGFGTSPPPTEPWGSAEYAVLVAEILDEQASGTKRVGGPVGGGLVVLGHSFGGRVAVRLAASRPDLVAGLVLTAAPVGTTPGPARRPATKFRVARALHRVGLIGDARMDRSRRLHGSADYRAAEGVMRSVLVRLLAEHYDEDLAALRCPLHLIWGEDDAEVPVAVAEAVTRAVPGARLTRCPGAGHLTPLTVPDVLRQAVVAMAATAPEARAGGSAGGGSAGDGSVGTAGGAARGA